MPTHDLYVDPIRGDDANNGLSPLTAKRTVPQPIGNRRINVINEVESARIHQEAQEGDE